MAQIIENAARATDIHFVICAQALPTRMHAGNRR